MADSEQRSGARGRRSRAVTVYGTIIILSGVYNLVGLGSYKQFSVMFRGLPAFLITAIYLFTVFYGICGVYCGSKILKLEDWARKTIIGLTTVSVISGFLLNRIVMANFKDLLASGQFDVPPGMAGSMYNYAVVITALAAIFEMSVIFFFTRSTVTRQFQ